MPKREVVELEVCRNGHIIGERKTGIMMDTSNCPWCGRETWSDGNYCTHCGRKLTVELTKCIQF